jgi:hypothetical protein
LSTASRSSEPDSSDSGSEAVLTLKERQMKPLNDALKAAQSDQRASTKEHKESMGNLFNILSRSEEQDRADRMRNEERDKDEREQAKLDREQQRVFIQSLLQRQSAQVPSVRCRSCFEILLMAQFLFSLFFLSLMQQWRYQHSAQLILSTYVS